MSTNIALGKLLSPFAVEGGIKVKSFSGQISHFKKLEGVSVCLVKEGNQKELKVTKVVYKGDMAVFYFEGYTSPESVKVLGGYELWAERRYGQPLGQNEYYMKDLVGCSVLFEGTQVAMVVSYMEASSLMLEAEKSDGSTFFIPFIAHFVGKVDLQAKTLELLSDECIWSSGSAV